MLPRLRRCYFVALLLLLLVGGTNMEARHCPEDSLLYGDICKCIPMSYCSNDECPEGMQIVQVKEAVPDSPGNCCPLYECRNQATLSYDRMEETHQCIDDQGQPREIGEHWLESDPCTNCSCEAPGKPRCQTTMCRSCDYPMSRGPNECCPFCPSSPLSVAQQPVTSSNVECPSLDGCSLDCQHGLLRDPNDCEICQCRPHPGCPPRILDCNLRCPEGYTVDRATGCPMVCQCLASCLDEDNLTRRLVGERWSNDPCQSCVCEAAGRVACNQTVCSVGCASPLPPLPGRCCPFCPPLQETEEGSGGTRNGGWGTIPIVLIVVLALLCMILMVHLVRNRFRSRLIPCEIDFAGFSHHHQQQQQQHQQQYYKCVPVYEPVLRHAEKIAAL